ncbi:MAG: MFS transporter, partial [Turicibacter sp.]
MNRFKQLISPYLGLSKMAYVIFFSRLINAMGCFVGPLMTLILTEKIGMSSSEAGVILTISSVLMIAPMLIGGKLADALGRKKTIILFDLLGVLSYFICGFIEPSMALVVMIMFASVCFSTAGPAHEALLADISTEENRQIIFSLSYMGWNLGFAIGAAVAGFLYENYLSWIFIGDALTGLFSLMLIILFVKDVSDTTEIKNDSEEVKKDNISILMVLKQRPKLVLFAFLMIGINFAYAQFNFLVPVHVANVFGADSGARYFGLMSSLNGFIVIAMTPVLTILFRKVKPILAITVGGFVYAFSFGMLGMIETLFI